MRCARMRFYAIACKSWTEGRLAVRRYRRRIREFSDGIVFGVA